MAVHGISADGRQLIGWSTVPVPFVTVAVILRFICRRTTAGIGADDWVMLGAVVLYYGLYATIVTLAVLGKAGSAEAVLSRDQLEMFLKIYFIIRYIYGGTVAAAKVSILLLYRRLFSVVSWIPWTTLVFGIFIVAWAVATSVAGMFECVPLGSYWDRDGNRHCINTKELFMFLAIFNMIVDFAVLAIPVPIIWRLKISTRHKLYLSGTFLLGTLACVAGALRIMYELTVNTSNISGTTAASIICFSFEAGVGIVTGCLPTLGSLLVKWRPIRTDANGAGWKRVSLAKRAEQKDADGSSSPELDHLAEIRSNGVSMTLADKQPRYDSAH